MLHFIFPLSLDFFFNNSKKHFMFSKIKNRELMSVDDGSDGTGCKRQQQQQQKKKRERKRQNKT